MGTANSVEFSVGLVVMTLFFLVFDFFSFRCGREGRLFPVYEFVIASVVFTASSITVVVGLNFLFMKEPMEVVLLFLIVWLVVFIVLAFVVLLVKCFLKGKGVIK